MQQVFTGSMCGDGRAGETWVPSKALGRIGFGGMGTLLLSPWEERKCMWLWIILWRVGRNILAWWPLFFLEFPRKDIS